MITSIKSVTNFIQVSNKCIHFLGKCMHLLETCIKFVTQIYRCIQVICRFVTKIKNFIMGQKVNPISLRLQKTNRHFDSCWYDDYNYTHLLLQDLKIKNYLKTVLHQIKYPESRIINYGVPKKNTYNIFYYNPSNSRRKKDGRFQLQNFKEKAYGAGASNPNKDVKSAFGRKIRKRNEKDIHSFFSFPKQQYWDYNTFTLAQRQIEGVAPHITPVDDNRKLPSKQTGQYKNRCKINETQSPSFFSLSNPKENLFLFNKNIYPALRSHTNQRFVLTPPFNTTNITLHITKGDVSDVSSVNLSDKSKNCSSIISKPKLTDTTHILFGDVKSGVKSHVKGDVKKVIYEGDVMTKCNTVSDPHLSKGYQREPFLHVNQLLLEFVIKNNRTLSSNHIFEDCESVNNKEYTKTHNGTDKNYVFVKPLTSPITSPKVMPVGLDRYDSRNSIKSIKNLDSERFFVRYLLAQFYCNYLQNKEKYNAESLSTLYRFLVFFQEKKVENGAFLKKYKNFLVTSNTTHITDMITSPSVVLEGDGKGGVSDTKTEKSSFLFSRSGVYSSNLLYKTYLEFSLSKQYSSFFNINLFRTLIEKQSASFIVEEIIYYLERKIPFRRIKTQILKEIPQYTNIKGIRIKCSGRVGGRSKKAQRSKTQSVKIGQTSLGVFSSKIDFACKSAYTRFGLIGIKVWVCYQ